MHIHYQETEICSTGPLIMKVLVQRDLTLN